MDTERSRKGLLPDEMHRRKHGFDIPIGEWFKGNCGM